MYWHIEKIIVNNSKWRNKFIDSLSIDLKLEFPEVTDFSVRNLKYMKKMAEEYPDFEFVQQVVAQIPWGYNIILIGKVKEIEIEKAMINRIKDFIIELGKGFAFVGEQ